MRLTARRSMTPDENPPAEGDRVHIAKRTVTGASGQRFPAITWRLYTAAHDSRDEQHGNVLIRTSASIPAVVVPAAVRKAPSA